MFYPEYEKYDISDIKALNKCEKPLEELYQGWMDFDGGIHESLEYSIDDTIETLKREQKKRINLWKGSDIYGLLPTRDYSKSKTNGLTNLFKKL